MNIAMTGATGYIGKHLSNYLTEKGGHRIIPLGRSMFREGMSGHLIQTLAHCDVIINLAGAPINKRWTPEHKQELFDSRVIVTHRIIRALNAVRTKPKLMISASAVGYYPALAEVDEYTRTRGDGFLSDLCYAWEKEARHCPEHTRLVITRFGVVLSPDGGAMQQMLRPLQAMKIAAAIGPGTQSFPWIDMRDLCRAMEFFISHEETRGVYNLVAPQQISQYTFAREMAKAYHAWATVVVPQTVFRILYGEAASFLTSGQRVRPTRLREAGFHFTVPSVERLFKGTDHSTVRILDLNRYMGLWYEIARYENRFERGLVDVTATYTLRPDGTIRVENRGCKRNFPYDICKTANGHAKIPDSSQPGKLKVSFFLNFYSDYYVLELDGENYNYALVGSSTDKYLWILSRTPQLPEEIKKKLVTAAERRGYDTNRLQWIEQF
ncbi:MAG: TIGR01777 family oxidoreductase [Bacteroides acidifaciens]|uniref:TIGR01777 family oxidoreductase n=1 Tax=Bacteroides acidifaciens TaxID=85831 RepID=UPI0023BD4A14|nr:TIGR01777 family oxidoreductase [Bacteroides acidifaciens]MDE6821593.1 TIGR01777 family oxidoreductase [Bacteroides acidifaciens]MDE6985680.1 TIGR01777 family oxidoreductase [Bacteroides acidifaciens]